MNRLLRHLLAPLVTYLVVKGWLPDYAQSDVTEILVIALGFLIAYAWSWLRDRWREGELKTGEGG